VKSDYLFIYLLSMYDSWMDGYVGR
jgi:hypothetical protein